MKRLIGFVLGFVVLSIVVSGGMAEGVIAPEGEPSPDMPAGTASPTYEEQVLEIVNQERWINGQLPPLKGVVLLDGVAETHSTNMANRDFFAHCDLDTKQSPWDRMTGAGYSYNSAAENIAVGYSSPTSVMTGWMNSSGHRANILRTSVWEIGIGYYYQSGDQGNIRQDGNGDCNADGGLIGPYYRYWTQNFGRRSGVYPVVINREAFETTSRDVALYVYGEGVAASMRFQNESGGWSAWMAYSADTTWTLSSGNGVKTVNMQISTGANGGGTIYSASDTIVLNEPITTPILRVSTNSMGFAAPTGTTVNRTQPLTLFNDGTVAMAWSVAETPDASWLSLSPPSGNIAAGGSGGVAVTVNPTGLSAGVYTGTIVVTAVAAPNSPQEVVVTLLIADYQTYLPVVIR